MGLTTLHTHLSQKQISEQPTHLKRSERIIIEGQVIFSLGKALEDEDQPKIFRYILLDKYHDGLEGEGEIGLSRVCLEDIITALLEMHLQKEYKIHQSKLLPKYASAAVVSKFDVLPREMETDILRVLLDGTVSTIHGMYSQKKYKNIHQSKILQNYASDAVAHKFARYLFAFYDALKYFPKCHTYSNIVNNVTFYSDKTNENIRKKKLLIACIEALKEHRAERHTQAKDLEMQQLYAKENENSIGFDTKVKSTLLTPSALNDNRSSLHLVKSLSERRREESFVSLKSLAPVQSCLEGRHEESVILVAQCAETQRSSSLSINTFDDDAHEQHSVNNVMLNTESILDFESELNFYILTKNVQSEGDTASKINLLRETYIFIRCAPRGFDAWLKSGVSIDIGKCFQKLQGFILCSQDSIGGQILEYVSSVLGDSLTVDKKGQVPVVQDGSSDAVIESSPAVAEVKPNLITQERVNCLRNKAEGNLPEMIVAQDIRGNDITRPYGIPTECSTDVLLEGAQLKTLCVGDPTANAAHTREESSNLSDFTNTPSPIDDSDTKSFEQTSELDLSLSPTALLKGQSAEQLQTCVPSKRLESATRIEETRSQESSVDEVRKDADLGKNSNFASVHYVGDSDCDFKDTSLEEGLSDGNNHLHIDCSIQNQGDLMGNTLETENTSVQNTEDIVQHPDRPVISDQRTMSDVRQVELFVSDARVFQAPIQANSPENSGLYLCYENGYCYEGLSDSSSRTESAGKSNSSYSTSNTLTDQCVAQDKLCEAVLENSSSPNTGFGESFYGQEAYCTGRIQPCQTSGHHTPITVVQEQSSYVYMGQEPGGFPHTVIAHATDETHQTSISSSTSHRSSVDCASLNTLAPSQFAPTFGASHHTSLAAPYGDLDRGVQPPLIVHAAGSRPPRTFAGQDLLDISHARNPEYRDLRARRATYNRTWDLIDSEADPASMALAGFFRPDLQRPRCVRCFYCGLELDFNGQSGWEEHLRLSPSCRYLQVMGGEQFVKEQEIRRTRK